MITLDREDTSIMIFNSFDEDNLSGGAQLGTLLLGENDSVTFHFSWSYGGQTLDFYGEDTTWNYSNWFSYGTSCSLGPIGELHVSAWGMEWGYDVALVLAAPDAQLHPVSVRPYVRLGGASRGDEYYMGTELCMNGLLPLTEPYSAMGWMPTGSGGEVAAQEVLAPQTYTYNNVVDWVLLELRDVLDPSIVVDAKCGLLYSYGAVTSEDGSSPVTFMAPYGNYYLAVRHRNHLGAMTAVPFNAMSLPTSIWLGAPELVMNGLDALVQSDVFGYFGLRPGNVPYDGNMQKVAYTGANNDRDAILLRLGSVVNSILSGYYTEDMNMNGVVSYTGANNDREVVLNAVGAGAINSVKLEQLP